ncbi:unnamed protein product [Parascedosporium putredinis]|uniref:Gfd2/YDR514C-like C-terminal domain-containing protein n=1 Tax=Parascedosporium putredinis TaxID=1442378 RepID=A0A9P1GWW9_9PEZI|nr:unnamed protein product [Parascedosporium putredinis]CAI7989229.1 unnamed protein product [Parascedosporium putredinis]
MPRMTDEEVEEWRPRIDFLQQAAGVEFNTDQFLHAIQDGKLRETLPSDPGQALVGKPAPGVTMTRGDAAPASMYFCPWRMVYHYPDWFIGKVNGPLARPLFDDFFRHQEWHFYYAFTSDTLVETPYLFVPTEQFIAFLNIVNAELKINLTIPVGENGEKFYVSFREGLPQPRYLCNVYDEESRQLIRTKNLPTFDQSFFEAVAPEQIEEFRWQLYDIASFNKISSKARSLEKQTRAREARHRMTRGLQALLGLRPFGPVLISLDVEAHELSHLPTEVGIVTLDTEKTKNLAPGKLGENWWPFVKSIHLRVSEYASHVNYQYVQGCPDKFDFGESEFVSAHDLQARVQALLRDSATPSSTTSNASAEQRQIVFVGHDLAQEERYLAGIGCDLTSENAIMRADSKDLHQHVSGELQGRSLRHVLLDLGLEYANLHNAGNDATYTLQAALACAVKEMQDGPAPPVKKKKKIRREEGFVPGAPKLTEADLVSDPV